MTDRFRNQERMISQEALSDLSFVVIGAGAIGSFFVTTLAKMGVNKCIVYDNDTIEDHNISNQMYPNSAIGKRKVDALRNIAQDYGSCTVFVKNERWHPDNAIDGDVIVVAVDNMDCRKAVWDYYKGREFKFFLEARMGAQVYCIYGIEKELPEAMAYYETKLYPQSEATPDRCGEKSIIYCVLSVTASMLSQVKRWINKEHRPTEFIYDTLRETVIKKHHREEVLEVIEAPDEPEVALV